ncbi:MAG: hypothetical protein EZS28_054854, partial [Streblomastix strix]
MEFDEASELTNPNFSELINELKSGDDDQRIKTVQSLLRYAAEGFDNYEQLVDENVFEEISEVSRNCGNGALF